MNVNKGFQLQSYQSHLCFWLSKPFSSFLDIVIIKGHPTVFTTFGWKQRLCPNPYLFFSNRFLKEKTHFLCFRLCYHDWSIIKHHQLTKENEMSYFPTLNVISIPTEINLYCELCPWGHRHPIIICDHYCINALGVEKWSQIFWKPTGCWFKCKWLQ